MHHEHGGNIYKYSNNNLIDFSANINPYGIPSNVKQAMHDFFKHQESMNDENAIVLLSNSSRKDNLNDVTPLVMMLIR